MQVTSLHDRRDTYKIVIDVILASARLAGMTEAIKASAGIKPKALASVEKAIATLADVYSAIEALEPERALVTLRGINVESPLVDDLQAKLDVLIGHVNKGGRPAGALLN